MRRHHKDIRSCIILYQNILRLCLDKTHLIGNSQLPTERLQTLAFLRLMIIFGIYATTDDNHLQRRILLTHDLRRAEQNINPFEGLQSSDKQQDGLCGF